MGVAQREAARREALNIRITPQVRELIEPQNSPARAVRTSSWTPPAVPPRTRCWIEPCSR